MNKAIIGKKLGMSQVFTADGTVIPVTVIQAGPCHVVQVKNQEKDGYSAVQLGFDVIPERLSNKPVAGHCRKAGLKLPVRKLQEFKLKDADSYEKGKKISCDIFSEGDIVDVTGISKGHGYSGAIKRWNQHRLKESHGTGPVVRTSGSMGSNSTPSRVLPGKKLPGHYGNEKTTVLNLQVVKVDADKNVLLIKGAVPGTKGSIVSVRSAVKEKTN
jgi:large subunit ribosomal protein L3